MKNTKSTGINDIKIQLIVNNLTIDVPDSMLNSMISDLHIDSEEGKNILEILAHHPSSQVRESVAYKDELTEETVKILAADPSTEVLSNLLSSDSAKEFLSTEEVLAIVQRDPSLARQVADSLDQFEQADQGKLADVCMKHPDPSVRLELVQSWSTPKAIIKKMLKDSNKTVAAEAAKRMLDR